MTLTTNSTPPEGACPGPNPISSAERARCRACGKCDAIAAILVQNDAMPGQDFKNGARRLDQAAR